MTYPIDGRAVRRTRRPVLIATTLVALTAPTLVRAQSVFDGFALPRSTWSVYGGATHTDNATLAPGGPSDTIVSAGFAGAFFKDTGRLRANVRGAAQYEEYVDGTFDSDVLASLNATAQYAFVPDRFTWMVEDTYGQVASNTFQPATPSNRTNVNFFSTGPDFVLRFGAASGVRVDARYARTDYESGNIDDQRYSGTVGVFRQLSAAATVSLNAGAQRVEYQSNPVSGYDTQEYYARLESRRTRYALALDVGQTQVHDQGESQSTPLVRLTAYRRLSPSWNLNVAASSEYRNSGDITRAALGQGRIVNGEVVYADPTLTGILAANTTLVNRPVRYESLRAGLDFARVRTTLGATASAGRERYQFGGQTLGRREWRVGANATRRLRPTLRADLAFDYVKRTFTALDQGDADRNASLTVSWDLSSRLSTNFGVRYQRRESDLNAFSFSAKMVYIGVTYGPGRPGPQAPPELRSTPAVVAPARP